jgi:hypothetical protein
VWSSVTMETFFMERPFEWVIRKQHGKPLTPEYLDFIDAALKRGADTDRLATTLVPSFVTSLVSGGVASAPPIVNLLLAFAKSCRSDLLHDRKLMDALALHLTPKYGIISPVVEFCLTVVDTAMMVVDLKEIVYKLHYIVTSSATARHLDCEEVTRIFKMFAILSKTDEWYKYTAIMALAFVRKKLQPRQCIHLIHSLLESISMFFLILVAEHDLLSLLRETLERCVWVHGPANYDNITWVDVYNMLNRKWPDLSASPSSPSSPSQDVEEEVCPITLCHFVKPVVASDGHTYERSAILRHMVDNGMISPMTKEPLTFILYDNWVAVRAQKKQRIVH